MMKKTDQGKGWIVFVSTFPPRHCGIATYTADLTRVLDETFSPSLETRVVAMNRHGIVRDRYPRQVMYEIDQEYPKDYTDVAKALNAEPRVKLVHIQHEFGIFGGAFGEYLLELTDALTKPFVVTFHTVLPDPAPAMASVVQHLSRKARRITVMTETARRILVERYGIDATAIAVVPHGFPPMPYQAGTRAKSELGVSGRTTLLTFGLLSRGKGIHHVIEALAQVVKKHPEVLYLVVGATHPVVLEQEGMSYLNELREQAVRLGLSDHVRFYHRFVSDAELQLFLQATDIYLSTSLDPNQAVSGTLSYALGSGRPVISTRFSQAKELITPEVGLLTDFAKPASYADALRTLLDDPKKRAAMGMEAYVRTRRMTWPNVALATASVYEACNPDIAQAAMAQPPLRLTHLERMTDGFGLIQFARLHVPDVSSGYTVDDNARALQVAIRVLESAPRPSVMRLAEIYLAFLKIAARPDGSFANYYGPDRQPHESRNNAENLADTRGRAFYALACAAGTSALPERMRREARELLAPLMTVDAEPRSLRAAAFFILGHEVCWKEMRSPSDLAAVRRYADWMIAHARVHATDGWEWFEPCLTYANGTLPNALLAAWQLTENPVYREIGWSAAEFLISQTFIGQMYVPIGQDGWCHKDGSRSHYDQQPEDVASMIQMLTRMMEIEPDGRYADLRQKAFAWFLGRNTLGQSVCLRSAGGCYDGVQKTGVNLNLGAESTLAYLSSLLEMKSSAPEAAS